MLMVSVACDRRQPHRESCGIVRGSPGGKPADIDRCRVGVVPCARPKSVMQPSRSRSRAPAMRGSVQVAPWSPSDASLQHPIAESFDQVVSVEDRVVDG